MAALPWTRRMGGWARHRTMVKAVETRATGIGGDSQMHIHTRGLAGGVYLRPRRIFVRCLDRDLGT